MRTDLVVLTALAIVDEGGADALTLRALAARLGSSTATLYRRFGSRAGLIDAVVDAVFGEVEFEDGGRRDWGCALKATSRSLFRALQRHDRLTPLMLERIPAGPNAMRVRQHVLELLLPWGFTPLEAIHTYATLGRYVLGFGVQGRSVLHSGEASNQVAEWIERFPFDRVTLNDQFEFGLELMIIGLRATLDARHTPSS